MKHINLKEALAISRQSDLFRPKLIAILISYYGLTVLNALLDGVGMVLLVNLISGDISLGDTNSLMLAIKAVLGYFGYPIVFKTMLFFTVILFTVRVFVDFLVWSYDGISNAYIRRKIQEHGFASILNGEWEELRNIRVGQQVGALTEESVVTTKYITSIARLLYYLVTTIVLSTIAFAVSWKLTLVMMIVGHPIFIVLRYFFAKQSSLSICQTKARQNFTADIAERLTTLFQIKVEGANEHYIKDGLKSQCLMTRTEMQLGVWQGIIAAFAVLMPAVALLIFYIWTSWSGQPVSTTLHLMAGVGIVGARTMTQVNGMAASWGNLARLSGSVIPVYNLFMIRQEPKLKKINDKLRSVNLDNISYRYDGGAEILNVSALVEKDNPLLIRGPSGSGKTTIANLMAGVLKPENGKVIYVGESSSQYCTSEYKANVGYVTQDISLFHGTIRDNLLASKKDISDDYLWHCLKSVGADEFVSSLGGMDAKIVEAGRSLSGGEKRRLGIARVLVGRPDIMIFDEVTAGLDDENRDLIREVVMNLSKRSIVSIITHEDLFNEIKNCVDIA